MNVVVINGIEYVPLIKEEQKPNLVNHYEKKLIINGVLKFKI
jgi:hypothetical protein